MAKIKGGDEIWRRLSQLKNMKTSYKGTFVLPSTKFKTKNYIDQDGLRARFTEANTIALNLIRDDLRVALDNAMMADWGGMGDIVDSGELMNSLEIKVSGNRIEINYNSPYANLIHYGGYIQPYGNLNIEKVYIPSRPWVETVINGTGAGGGIDFEGIYKKALRQVFG